MAQHPIEHDVLIGLTGHRSQPSIFTMTTPNDGLQFGTPATPKTGPRVRNRRASQLSKRVVDARFAGLIAENFADDAPVAPSASRQFGPRDWPASAEVVALEDAETHFVPPEPGPVLTTTDPVRRLAVIGACALPVLAILVLLFRAVIGAAAPIIGIVLAIGFVASLALLLWRMPERRSRDDDGDDGAVV